MPVPLSVKLHTGDCKRESSPNPQKCGDSNSTKPCSSESIISKASQLAQRYHNPDPILRLIGPANEVTVVVDDHEYPSLIDSGAQLTQMSLSLVKTLGLPIHALNTIIEAKPMGGGSVAYLRFVEARPKFKDVTW